MAQADEAGQIDEVIRRVSVACPEVSSPDVARVVRTVHAGFDNARIREFVPLLVERTTRAVLAHRCNSVD